MAQFRATVQGQRGQASRLGSKRSGLRAAVNGWDSGIYVEAAHDDKDKFYVYATGGSHGGPVRLLGVLEHGEWVS